MYGHAMAHEDSSQKTDTDTKYYYEAKVQQDRN